MYMHKLLLGRVCKIFSAKFCTVIAEKVPSNPTNIDLGICLIKRCYSVLDRYKLINLSLFSKHVVLM